MENCYIVGDEETGEAMLVDPGEQIGEISREIEASGLDVKKIVNTHTHLDHVAGVETFKKELGVPFYIHEKEQPVLDVLPEAKMRFPGFDFVESPGVDGYVKEGEELRVGNLRGEILLVPGHTWGHVCFAFGESIIAGDTVFAGSVGRVDLTGGTSMRELVGSIKIRDSQVSRPLRNPPRPRSRHHGGNGKDDQSLHPRRGSLKRPWLTQDS